MTKGPYENKITTWTTELQSPERPMRQQALKAILEHIEATRPSQDDAIHLFDQLYLHLLKCYADKYEMCRSLAASVISSLATYLPANPYYLEYVFGAIAKRLGQVETIEESEELRLQLLQQITALVEKYRAEAAPDTDPFLNAYNDTIDVLKKCLMDPYPAAQKECCSVVELLAEATPSFHYRAESLVKPASIMLQHRYSTNRIAAVAMLTKVVLHIRTNDECVVGVIMDISKLLMDDVAAVRREVGRAGVLMALELRDRYSHFWRILPLILCCLNDEVEEVRREIVEEWQKVGWKYFEENEEEMKRDLMTDKRPERYPDGVERPSLGCRVLVQRSLKMVNVILSEMEDWKEEIRLHSAKLLDQVVLHAEKLFATSIVEAYPVIAKTCADSERTVAAQAQEIASKLGILLEYRAWIDVARDWLTRHPNLGNLSCFYFMFKAAGDEKWEDLSAISELFIDHSICWNLKDTFQLQLFDFCQVLVEGLSRNPADSKAEFNLFNVTLTVMALSEEEQRNRGYQILQKLSPELNHLADKHLPALISSIEGLDAENNENSPIILLLIGTISICGFRLSYLPSLKSAIITAIASTTPNGRVRIFSAISIALLRWLETAQCESIEAEIVQLRGIVDEIIAPYLVWQAGIGAESVRTMATAALCSLAHGASSDAARTILPGLSVELAALVEDNNLATRSYALRAILCAGPIPGERLRPLMLAVLSRLDDASAEVREHAANCLGALQPADGDEEEWRKTVEHVLNTMILHLNSPEVKLRAALVENVREIGKRNPVIYEAILKDLPENSPHKKDLVIVN